MTEPIFTGINHICIATRDLDRAIRAWYDRYGIGPWKAYTFTTDTMSAKINGEPLAFGMRVGMAYLDPTTRVEIIEPVGDEANPYATALVAHNDADHVHHIRFDVADFAQSTAAVEALGVPKLLEGRYQALDPDIHSKAVYFDTTADLGVVAEIAELPEGFAMPEPDYVYPAAAG
jgi:catechol 2,3-dioxygenase-like lactoylglutathione lyase family enzyme